MFGPAMETFKGGGKGLIGAAITALFVGGTIWVYAPEWGELSLPAKVTLAALAGVVLWLFYWLFSVRVSFHPEGLTYHSCFGEKQMRWDEVEKLYYSAMRHSVNFIPIGTYYSFRLVAGDGKKISFGDSVEKAGEVGNRLIQCTAKPVFDKLAERFNSGAELDFGPIKLSRQDGIRMPKLFGTKAVALNEVAEYRIEAGNFYIFKVGEKRASGVPIGQIPNAFVLLGLLDSIFHPAG